MVKAQAKARFVTEVAPPQVVSVMRRRRKVVGLDTIVEDDREQQLTVDHQSWSRRAPARERAGRLARELSECFSDGHGQKLADGGWEGGCKLGHQRVVKI